jgi:hypothetical protein
VRISKLSPNIGDNSDSLVVTVKSTQRKFGLGTFSFPPETQTAFSIIIFVTFVFERLPLSQKSIALYSVKWCLLITFASIPYTPGDSELSLMQVIIKV